MPFAALHNGVRVHSPELDYETARAYPKGTLTCIGCEKPMHIKRYTSTGTQFFSHYTDIGCLHGKNESPAHLRLKQRVYEAAVACGWTAAYEHRLDTEEGLAIIDVLLTSPDGKKQRAVEIQLSRQLDIDYQKRSRFYARNRIDTLWLTRHNAPERRSVIALQLLADGNAQAPIEAYTCEDIRLKVSRGGVTKCYIARPPLEEFLSVWLAKRIHFQRELTHNYRVMWKWGSSGLDIVTDTTEAVWITPAEKANLATAESEARKELERQREEQWQRHADNIEAFNADQRERGRLAARLEEARKAAKIEEERLAELKAAELEAKNKAEQERLRKAREADELEIFYRNEGMILCDYEPRAESRVPRDKYAHVYRWHSHEMEAAVAKPLSTLAEQLERCLAYNEKRGRTADVETLAWQLGVSQECLSETYRTHRPLTKKGHPVRI